MENREIIINKNSKKHSKKSMSKENPSHPFIVSNTESAAFIISNNNNNKINANEDKIEKKVEIKKSENKQIDNFPPLLNSFLEFDRLSQNDSHSNDHISLSIKKLSGGDDMDILNELISLCDFLSLSNDRIGFNPNISKLLEEICKNLTKTYIPEIVIYSLQCINHILDINSTLAFILKKVNAISSIMNTISCIEDITCLDYIIKIFDKISTENSKLLLENNVFESFLVNIFDFLNIYQKKSLMKICYNISLRRVNITEYNKYIKPALNILINLIKIEEDDNADNLFITEKATNILYNIINAIKYGEIIYNKEKDEENALQELINKYNIIENFMDILNKYFIKNNQLITDILIRTILKTIVLILEISKEGMDKILSNKFLEIIADTVNNEIYTNSNDSNNSNNNNNIIIVNKRKNSISNKRGIIFLFEFFDILIALFPSWKYFDAKNKKILNPENKVYYDYFCQNIFLPLINNIRNKSSNKILNNLIKLILAFINNADKNDVILYLPPKPISQIIIKLLDSKKNSSIIDATSLIRSLMEKAPENYIVNFVREGIIHNLKNIKLEEKKLEFKSDSIRLDDFDKNSDSLGKINLKSGIEIISRDSSFKSINSINNNDKISFITKDQIKGDKNIISEIINRIERKKKDNNSENKFINLINNNEKEKDKYSLLLEEKENLMSKKNIILKNNPINEKLNTDGEGKQSSISKDEAEFKFKLNSVFENAENEEDDHEEEDIENNDISENEEKEEEEEEENSFVSKKKSIVLNSSYSEDKEKIEEIENKSKKEKEKEKENIKNSINNKEDDKDFFILDSIPKKKNLTQKESKVKKFDFFEEELNLNTLNNNKNNDDTIMKDSFIDSKSAKEEEIKDIININDNKKNDEKNKFNEIKKSIYNLEDSQQDLLKKKIERGKDYLKRKMDKYHEIEDNLNALEIKTIKENIKTLLNDYLTDEKISKYLSNTENKTKDSLIKIQTTLSNYKELLSSTNIDKTEKEKYVKEIIDTLTNESISITLFELENSKILLSLSNYFEPEFNKQYEKLKDDNEYDTVDKLIDTLSDKNLIPEKINYNLQIFAKLKKFFECFEGDKKKIINFIKLLNESIDGMNCPILQLVDSKPRLHQRMSMRPRRMTNIKLKMEYNENIFKDDVLNGNLKIDNCYKTKLCEINMYFKTNKRMSIAVSDNSTFKNMSVNLLSAANIPLIANNKYDICLKYSIKNDNNKIENEKKSVEKMDIEENIDLSNDNDYNNNSKKEENNEIINIQDIETNNNIINNNSSNNNEEKGNDDNIFYIDENWSYKTFLENYSKDNKIEIPFNIQFGLSIKLKNNDAITNNEIQIENDDNGEFNGFLNRYFPYIEDSINFAEYINFDKYCFLKDYHNNIIYGKSLYFSKRLMPCQYLLSLLNICINKYNELFELPKSWFINNEKNKNEWKKLFFNLKIDQFINKISLDSYKITKTSFPFLCEYITKNNHTLTKFHTRFLSFKTSFASTYKSIINLQNHLKHNNPNYQSKYSVTLKKTMRFKINVERDKIIEHGFNIINDEITSKFKGYLEFEYKGEIGNGLGPTLEFYTLIINKIAEDKSLWYKTTDGSLYPILLNENEDNEKKLNMFKLLGYIIGRAIYDDRLIDIPLSKVFWNLVMDKPLLFKSIKIIDSNLYKALSDFLDLINKKKEYIKTNNLQNNKNINFDGIILYNNSKLSELDIYFTFPGYDNIELKKDGSNILLTMNNIEEYVNLIYDYLFYKGIDKILNSFKEGFNMNFNIGKLKSFTSSEIEEYICGSIDMKWDKNILYDNLKPEHGYTNQSKIFNDLIKFMCTLDKEQRKKFLIFSTGSSRLPIGGFKALSPKLTVVKKHCEEENNPDDYLPTVMTCQNYLKIPEYSCYDILQKKMLLAMKEGCNEFNLS